MCRWGARRADSDFEREVVAARKDNGRFIALRHDKFLQEKCARLGAVEFLGDPGGDPDLGKFDQPGGEQRLDVVLDPGGVFAEGLAKLGQCGRGVHQQAQDRHAAGIGKLFDLFKGMEGFELCP